MSLQFEVTVCSHTGMQTAAESHNSCWRNRYHHNQNQYAIVGIIKSASIQLIPVSLQLGVSSLLQQSLIKD